MIGWRPIRRTLFLVQRSLLQTHAYTMATQQYKLKLNPADVEKPGSKVEVEVEGVDAKVLLVNVGGDLRAMSHKCTHYGAPLVKGVLTSDGRITCPWHGACFSTSTGDIEDAPGLDPLVSFKCSHRDGGVYIDAEESALKAGRRKPKAVAVAEAKEPQDNVLVVGGGPGALGTVEGLREAGFKGRITVLSKEAYPPIDRTRLSKALVTDASKLAWRSEEFFKTELLVDFHTGTEVTKVDAASRTVTTSDGKSWSYTTIVLATGGTPRKLPMPGFKGLANVFTLRGIETAKSIVDATAGGKKQVVIVGSSFIGLEVANALAKNHDITVIGMESAPLERVLGAEIGNKVRRILEKSGIKFKLSASVEDAIPSESDKGKVGGIKLKDGEVIPADVVILGVGVAPETTYLKESGWQLEPDGAVAVDKTFAVKGVSNAYAVGDIARYPYVFLDDAPVRIEHWNVALNAGRAVGHLLAGPTGNANNIPAEFIPVFWSALGQQVRYCGHPATGYDEVIIKPDGAPDDKFIAYYAKGEKIVAVATIGSDPAMVQAAELLRARKFPSKSEIQQGVDILALAI